MLPSPPPPPPSLISPESIDRRSPSYSPSLLIIAGLLAFAVAAIASIHLLLRYLSRSRQSPSPPPPPPFLHHHLSSSSSSSSSSNNINQEEEEPPKNVIDSLPLFTLSASASASASLDCAVCLSPLELRDELRLLPSCRHAFHSHCIDTWLRSTLSCPLCRSSVHPPPPPPPPPPPHPQSESFRVEIGSASRRTADQNPPPPPPPPHVRTYSLGSSSEYSVEEEVEAVISRIRRPEKPAPPHPPGEAVAEMAGGGGGGGGGSRNWLSDYVDRLVSSASSSFSSLRWSRRFDSGGGAGGANAAAATSGGENWDLERNLHLHLEEEEEEEDGGFSSFYRWLLGA